MALTDYIRSWDPRSTYPKNPQEGDICYTITLDQTWAPVGGVKKDNIVKEEIYQNGAWVEQGGGPEPSGTKVFEGNITGLTEVVSGIYQKDAINLDTTFETLPDSLNITIGDDDYELPFDSVSEYYGELEDGEIPVFTTYPVAIAFTGEGGTYKDFSIMAGSDAEISLTIYV